MYYLCAMCMLITANNIIKVAYKIDIVIRTLDLRLQGRWFDSWLGRLVSIWMGDCLRTGKPSR